MPNTIIRALRTLAISRRHRTVRRGWVYVFTNFLLAVSVVFFIEIVMIALGLADVTLPMTKPIRALVGRILF